MNELSKVETNFEVRIIKIKIKHYNKTIVLMFLKEIDMANI